MAVDIGDPSRAIRKRPASVHEGEGIQRRAQGLPPAVPLASDVGPSPTDPGAGRDYAVGVQLRHVEARHQLQDLVDEMNRQIQQSPLRESISLALQMSSGKFTVVVVDSRTDQVIREVPLNRVLNAASRKTGIAGILKDMRA